MEVASIPKSTRRRSKRKPKRSHPDFPLWPHPSGRWCRKIKKRFHYFGKVADDPDGKAALEHWLRDKDDLLAGRPPRSPEAREGLSVGSLCNHFLTFKTSLLNSGELAERTFQRYHNTCKVVVETFGKTRLVDDLRPEDFQELRSTLAATWGPVGLANEIQTVRSLFKYGFEAGLLDKPARFGPAFKKPSAKVLRLNRAKAGPRLFERDELLKAMEHATVNGKAMILLGINATLRNTDLALLL